VLDSANGLDDLLNIFAAENDALFGHADSVRRVSVY